MGRLQIGVVGCGIAARSRYFPLLWKLSENFAVARLCDVDSAALEHARRLFPEAEYYSSLVDLAQARGSSLDAVLLLADGDHHDLLLTLAEHGLPTFVEKPISYTRGRAVECVREFEVRGLPLQVGYMKRYYDSVGRITEVLAQEMIVSVSVDLVHPPEDAYLTPVLGHGRQATSDLGAFLDSQTSVPDVASVLSALGVDRDDVGLKRAYFLLATSAIHDVNLLRGLLGEPETVSFADFWNEGLAGRVIFSYSATLTASLTFAYVETAGYEERVRLVGNRGRWSLDLPSPYLPHAPAVIESVRGSSNGLPVVSSEPVSLVDPFETQLLEFRNAVEDRRPPRIDGRDAAADLALVERIVTVAASIRNGASVVRAGREV